MSHEDVREFEKVSFGLPFGFDEELLEKHLGLVVELAEEEGVALGFDLRQVVLVVIEVYFSDDFLLLTQTQMVRVELEGHSRHVAINQPDNVLLGLGVVVN